MDLSDNLRREIERDIGLCKDQTEVNGSEILYNSIVARYSVLDPNFKSGLPNMGKMTTPGREFDFRKDLLAVSEKLRMWLLAYPSNSNSPVTPKSNSLKEKVEELIKRGEKIKIDENNVPARGVIMQEFVAGPMFDAWMGEINILNQRHLEKHPLHMAIYTTYFHRKSKKSTCDDMLGHLRALATDDEFFDNISNGASFSKTNQNITRGDKNVMNNKVFIVHGHDEGAKQTMARALEKAGFEAIILHEQASGGKTIIEKIEANSNVSFAVVLYTPCDLGRSVKAQIIDEKKRARQNVVFEHGYLIGKLGRERVCALVHGDVETPGDMSGVVYITLDEKGAWKMDLAKEMKNAGLTIKAKFYD